MQNCSMARTDSKLLSDHFNPWLASPYHLLHPFMQPIINAYNHTKKKQYFIETRWGGLSLEPEARTTWAYNHGHRREVRGRLSFMKACIASFHT